jgi:DNA repair protein RAD50
LTRRIEVKTREKDRVRATRETEVSERQTVLFDFQSEVKDLRRLTSVIEEFLASGKLQKLEDHAEKVAALLSKIEAKQKEKDELAPRLAEAAASVENQERYKKLLSDNINFIKEEEKIKEMDEKLERLEEELGAIEGADDVRERLDQASKSQQKLLSELARMEGRKMELAEKIRSLRRKLSTDEYKDVDEQLRVTNIKYNTTRMAAADIKKYYIAVEQALLRYHTVKIAVRCLVAMMRTCTHHYYSIMVSN